MALSLYCLYSHYVNKHEKSIGVEMASNMKVRYRDLRVKDRKLKKELLDSVDKVLSHGRILIGPEVNKFEANVARYVNSKFCVGLGSGTDAIYLALKALNVGYGDEVITTPMSWISTLNAIELTGATAIFSDISADLNINPQSIKSKITPKTKVILPVHFTGRICKMNPIMEIANDNNIVIVEDAAQAFGAHLDHKMAGTFGRIGCYSMNSMKMLNSYGEAGAVVFNKRSLYSKMISLRYNGTINKEDCVIPSKNARIDTVQAAMMNVNLKYLNDKINKIRKIASFYNDSLRKLVICPLEDESYHVYYTYTIMTKKRDELMQYLLDNGIETKIYHPILMPFHSAYKDRNVNIKLPVAEKLVQQILSIPNHDAMTENECDYVVEKIKDFFK
jgi:dTDP-4-amino-4,6-dideoxygalactose transaminase